MARVGVARLRGNRGAYVDGLTEARAALASLPEAFREVAAETIGTGSQMIFDESQRRVPVDKSTLKNSGGRNVRPDGLQASVGYGDYKAKWVQFGTNDTPAQDFLWAGFRKGARFVRKEMKGWTEKAGRKVSVRAKKGKGAKESLALAKTRR